MSFGKEKLIHSNKESFKKLSKTFFKSSSLNIIFLLTLFIKTTFISCQNIISIMPFQNKTFILNESNRYVIYELKNENNGTIYTYFKIGDSLSTKVTVYYDKSKILYNKDNEEFENFVEQKSLYKTTFLTFNSSIGNMYFVISNFDVDFMDDIHIINDLGYYDITNEEYFKYFYKFNKTTSYYDKRTITFSFKNDVKKKNYLSYQINTFRKSINDNTEITTKQSNLVLNVKKYAKSNIEHGGTVDLSNFKNETINIKIIADSYVWTDIYDSFEILIYYSEYANTYPLYNNENSFAFIPSLLVYPYYIYVNIEKAYDNIYLNMKTNITNYVGSKYYFLETNKIKDIIDIIPNIEPKEWSNIISSQISEKSDNLYVINIKKMNNHKSVLFQINTTDDVEFTVNFFKKISINEFQNQTFDLFNEQNYVIYEFNNQNDNFIYTYFKNGNIPSTVIYLYYYFYDIYIDKDNHVLNYNKSFTLNSNIFQFSYNNGPNYILISNFERNFSDTFSLIIPYEYYDITQYNSFQFLYKIINKENNMTFTLSLNNKIKKKNFLNYQIYNYQNDQKDNTLIYENNTLNEIQIKKLEYGGIVDLKNYKNDIINIKFNISSTYKFDLMIISIYYSDYQNLYKVSLKKDEYFFIPSTKNNEFYLFSDISDIKENIIFILQTELKEISDKYYYYNTSDINEVYSNLPNDDNSYNCDGYYKSYLLSKNENILQIHINKTKSYQKSILLKMKVNTNVNVTMINNPIYDIKFTENRIFNLTDDNFGYTIFGFDKPNYGNIYVFFNTSYRRSTKVSLYYDFYKININKNTHEISDYISQQNLEESKFVIFKIQSYIGKIYILVSNYAFSIYNNKISILNDAFNDITDYEYFEYNYFCLESTKYGRSSMPYYFSFSFKNDIKKKNFFYYQIKNHPSPIVQLIANTSQIKIPGLYSINISNFKNETINFEISLSTSKMDNIADPISLLIFFSDYKYLFVLNPPEINYLTMYRYNRDNFYIYTNFTQNTKELYLYFNTTNSKCLSSSYHYYLYETDQIKEIEHYLIIDNYKPNEKYSYLEYIETDSIYSLPIKRSERKFKSAVTTLWMNGDNCSLTLQTNFYKVININTSNFSKIEFKLNEEKSFIIYKLNNINNTTINNVDNKLYIYFEKNSSNSLQIDIYKNYSDINIDEFGKIVRNSYIQPKLDDRDFIELNNFNENIFIVVSNFLKNEEIKNNSLQIVRTDVYYDITDEDIFRFNFKYKMTSDKRILSFKINTTKTKSKYLHFQINNNQNDQTKNLQLLSQSNQIEYLEFKNQNNQSVKYENNCINLTDYSNQIIFMNFGLSSESSIDNYDIILRKSNYYLYYPFNEDGIFEISFIKNYSFYVYSYFSDNIGYSFIINSKQDEIEYYYLDKDNFNENDINISDLKPEKIKTVEKDGNITFSIKKKNESNKIIIIKINIDKPNDFKIIRSFYIDNNEKKEESESESESEINGKSNLSIIIIVIVIFVLMIFIIVGFRFYKVYKKNQNKNLNVDNVGPLQYNNNLNEMINKNSQEE